MVLPGPSGRSGGDSRIDECDRSVKTLRGRITLSLLRTTDTRKKTNDGQPGICAGSAGKPCPNARVRRLCRRCFVKALAPRSYHALDHHAVLLRTLDHRSGNYRFASALLLGRDRQHLDHAALQNPDSGVAKSGTDRLRLRDARSERLEPRAPLSICLDTRLDRSALRRLRISYRPFPQKFVPSELRSLVASILQRNRKRFTLQTQQ